MYRIGLVFMTLLGLGGCEVASVEIAPAPDVVVAGVTVVLTLDDPAKPSRLEMSIVALITRSHLAISHELPGATVRVTGEHGQSVLLSEVPDPTSTCVTQLSDGFRRPPAGSCHVGRASWSHFAPGEQLSLLVTLPDGGILTGESRLPGSFTPLGLSLKDGGCRVQPDTGHDFSWPRVDGAQAYIAEAQLTGLGELWQNDEPLYLVLTLRDAELTNVFFPRDFLYELIDRKKWELHRVLHQGLPEGASANVTIGAVDRNWANWTRARRTWEGQVRVPSVFGDGTGMFGTAVRWQVSVESRVPSGDGDLPLCGAGVAD